MRPFCQILIRATRGDSSPWQNDRQSLRNLLKTIRIRHRWSQETLASKLRVHTRTIKNWEGMRTVPHPPQIKAIHALQKGVTTPCPRDSNPCLKSGCRC